MLFALVRYLIHVFSFPISLNKVVTHISYLFDIRDKDKGLGNSKLCVFINLKKNFFSHGGSMLWRKKKYFWGFSSLRSNISNINLNLYSIANRLDLFKGLTSLCRIRTFTASTASNRTKFTRKYSSISPWYISGFTSPPPRNCLG